LIRVTRNSRQYDPFYNIAIILWLFSPIFFVFLGIVGFFFTTNFDSTLNEFNTRYILNSLGIFSGDEGIKIENLGVLFALAGSFFLYCYFFDLIQKKGFAIFSLDGQDSKFSSALPYIFFSSLTILYFLAFIAHGFEYTQFELYLSAIFFIVLMICLFLYTEFLKKVLTYDGLIKINHIQKYRSHFPRNYGIKDQISFCWELFDICVLLIFILSLFTLFIWIKYNLNIFSLFVIEGTLIYLSLIYSSIRLAPKKMMNLTYKHSSLSDNNVFILSESIDYYTILFENDRIEFVMKDTIRQILPNPEFDNIEDFKIESPVDEIKDAFTLKNIVIIFGFVFVCFLMWAIIGALVYSFVILLNPLSQCFTICIIIIISAIGLRFYLEINSVIEETNRKIKRFLHLNSVSESIEE